jgi:hypothetical protein
MYIPLKYKGFISIFACGILLSVGSGCDHLAIGSDITRSTVGNGWLLSVQIDSPSLFVEYCDIVHLEYDCSSWSL